MSPTLPDLLLVAVERSGYPCTLCQAVHQPGDDRYASHRHCQAKGGVQRWTERRAYRTCGAAAVEVPVATVMDAWGGLR